MLKKVSIGFVILTFILSTIILSKQDKNNLVLEVKTPTHIKLNNNDFAFQDFQSFDCKFSEQNKNIAKILKITETEAFILGNLGKYWAENQLSGRDVLVLNNDLIYDKNSYKTKFFYSGYCLKENKPCSDKNFQIELEKIRKSKYKIIDLETEKSYDIENDKIYELENFVIVPKSTLLKKYSQTTQKTQSSNQSKNFNQGDIKIFLTDFTTVTKPDRNCSSNICQEIISNINNSKTSIDIAIYGYSRVPEIEMALKSAIARGVKIRLIYDLDSNSKNIYPDTHIISDLITNHKTDAESIESKNIMHNKFYIFDNKITITGSANLSHTDMSSFNTNSIAVIDSRDIAKIYKTEFEQMFNGKFHNDKVSNLKHKVSLSNTPIEIYFSPQDKAIEKSILPLINNAKKYIYIPTFVLTEKRVAEALIKAKNRGVEIKIIIDALSASNKHTKHSLLRTNGILVKTETFAGKMHSKSIIIDDEYTIIGSMNFSNSGENRNDENLIVIKDAKITNFYKEFFLYQWNKIDNKWLKFNAKAESNDSFGSCSDGIDNDYDGYIDKMDSACK